ADPNNAGKSQLVQVPAGKTDNTIDGGLVPFGSVGDFVWNDQNGDGIQDAGEPGVQDVTVNLLDAAGNQVATTTSDFFGNYQFNTPDPTKQYRVQFGLPANSAYSPFHAGNDPTVDSDADPNNAGKSQLFQVAAGKTDNTIDGGLAPFG